MSSRVKWRARAKAALQSYFRRRSFPRITLTLLLAITGAVGFFISYLLLRLGMEHMWARYPIAVLVSYAVLLSLIRVWVEIERARFDPADAEVENTAVEDWDGSTLTHGSSRSSWDYLDFPSGIDVFEADDGCLPAILVLVVVTLVTIVFVTIAAAPALIAEVFLDAFIVAVLYRRLRIAQREHWLGTALRKTWLAAFATALALALGGWALEQAAPGARSIGKAIEQIRSGELP
jgi:hypothetical protein